jgi:pimeloyl-ACP methyl ester carboxylesterase
MRLELLSDIPSGALRGVSVLFVHGICLGAWVWRENFMPYLSAQGYPAYALSLRGHGRSEGGRNLRGWHLKDFAADLEWAAGQVEGPLVIVGHSMGGGVAQHYLYRGGKAAGMALMASVPPHGLMRASFAMYNRNPGLWHELSRLREGKIDHVDFDIIERGMLSHPASEEQRATLLSRLCDPALTASLELMGWRPLAPLPWTVPPMLVIGGERDEFIPKADVELTGLYYGVRPIILPECAHAIMLEQSWRGAADHLCAWLETTFESRSSRDL